jgi:uncharacterized protein YbbC (DUF1343 family)
MLVSVKTYGQSLFSTDIVVGAEQVDTYLPLLLNKRVAVVANQSSLIHKTHLIDSLLRLGVKVQKVFCPEHGFRGVADAGESVKSNIDKTTGLPIISLYGKHKKPTVKDLEDIDIVVFDIQDVGVRFYTYISTLHYVMEACAEEFVPVLLLDRPNPNGFYIDGPALDTTIAKSFVGMHPVPLVYGMTIGEYALMINGEGWLENSNRCNISVVSCIRYNHNLLYRLPIKPSPNLPNEKSIILYPSLGLFEGTVMSVGRGTDFPFQVYGHPDLKKANFTFTPVSKKGAKNPKYKNRECRGYDLRSIDVKNLKDRKKIQLDYLIQSYNYLGRKTKFFNNYFLLLSGTKELQKQIEQHQTEEEIRESWQEDISKFKLIRKKYLLYNDF